MYVAGINELLNHPVRMRGVLPRVVPGLWELHMNKPCDFLESRMFEAAAHIYHFNDEMVYEMNYFIR